MHNPIFDANNWREIISTLSRNKMRTFLTALGIFWGTMMLTLLWGGAHGLEGMLKRNFAGIDQNIGGVSNSRTTMSYKGFNKGRYFGLNELDYNTIKSSIPELKYVTGFYWNNTDLSWGSKTKNNLVMGIDEEYEHIMAPVMLSGRWLNAQDMATHAKVAVIGESVADELFGDTEPVGQILKVGGIHVLIVGVATQRGEASVGSRIQNTLIMPSPTMRPIFRADNKLDYIAMVPKPGYRIKDLAPRIRRAVRSHHPIHPDDDAAIDVSDMSEMFEMIDKMFLGVSLLALVVGAGSLMAGIIGVGNIMWIIVKERTKEIGIRRAIGAKPRDIIAQVLCESMFLTAVAGTAGICSAVGVLAIADKLTADPILGSAGFTLTFTQAISVLAAYLVLGTLAGILPARKAMNIKPIQALNDK